MTGTVIALGLALVLGQELPERCRRSVVRRRARVLDATRETAARTAEAHADAAEELAVELVMVLVASALRSGAPVPRALAVVASRLPEAQGQVLRRVCRALEWGASWRTATSHVEGPMASLLAALAPAWESGASPTAALRLWSEQLRRERQAVAREAAARLSVHLVLPLGACLLPAFVLLGLVPLVMSFGLTR